MKVNYIPKKKDLIDHSLNMRNDLQASLSKITKEKDKLIKEALDYYSVSLSEMKRVTRSYSKERNIKSDTFSIDGIPVITFITKEEITSDYEFKVITKYIKHY